MPDSSFLLPLSRPFPSRDQIPVIEGVDRRIFHLRYFAACMSCTFCHDSCCQHGCGVDSRIHARLLQHAEGLEARVGRSREEWFGEQWFHDAEEAPDGRFLRTQVVEERCVFVDRRGRGCHIHSYCIEAGLDYHELKPRACWLFPLVYIQGVLQPAYEIREERSLVCVDQGPTLYEATRGELEYYFGAEMVRELDLLARGEQGSSVA